MSVLGGVVEVYAVCGTAAWLPGEKVIHSISFVTERNEAFVKKAEKRKSNGNEAVLKEHMMRYEIAIQPTLFMYTRHSHPVV